MGYSESISAHTVITTTDNRGHHVHGKCMRNESAVCMSHACMWTSWFVDVICVACDVYTPILRVAKDNVALDLAAKDNIALDLGLPKIMLRCVATHDRRNAMGFDPLHFDDHSESHLPRNGV